MTAPTVRLAFDGGGRTWQRRSLGPQTSPTIRLAASHGQVGDHVTRSLGPQPEQAWQIRDRLRSMTDEQLDELSTGLHSMSDEELTVRLEA